MNNLKALLTNSIKIVVTVIFCTLLFVSNAFPAAALTSDPTKGEAKLNNIQKTTDDLTKRVDDISRGDTSVYPNLKEVQENSKGLNELQGSADADKMITPEDATADGATSIKEQIGNLLEGVTK